MDMWWPMHNRLYRLGLTSLPQYIMGLRTDSTWAVLGIWGCSQELGLFAGIENRKSVIGIRKSEIGNQKSESPAHGQPKCCPYRIGAVLALGLSWHLGCP